MIIRLSVFILFSTFIIAGCATEIGCENARIQTAFIKFSNSDIDTFVIKKFKANDNYQTLIDTFTVAYGWTGYYTTSNDTTSVFLPNIGKDINAGFDWQIFIPSKNKTVFISDIVGEKKTIECRRGIFSMDKFDCHCINKVFSAKKDGQVINFPDSDTARNIIYILN